MTLEVRAQGEDPLEYQWLKDGEAIEGATEPSYRLDAATPEDAGQYDVVVSGLCSSVASAPAEVTVLSCDPFLRADPDESGESNLTDVIFLFRFLFLGGAAPSCRESADVDNSGEIEITDGISLLNYLPRRPAAGGSGAPALRLRSGPPRLSGRPGL